MYAEILQHTPHMAPSQYAGKRNNAYRNSALTGEQTRRVHQMRLIPALFKNNSSALSKEREREKERDKWKNGVACLTF
jgi:hypothetical protein